ARLDLARRRAAVAVDGIAVVALLTVGLVDGQQQAVAAGGRAGPACGGADRLETTEGRAAVTSDHVAVIALLGAFLDLVSANGGRARRRALAAHGTSGRRADPALGDGDRLALERADGAAAVAVRVVAV